MSAFLKSQPNKARDFILQLIVFTGVFLAILGWIQYFLYPDLRNLYYLGWDPHYRRIFSTYFDPNFLGLIMVFTLVVIFSSFASFVSVEASIQKVKDKKGYTLTAVAALLTASVLLFTYSRSSYLAFGSSFLYLFIKRKKRLILLLIWVLTVFLFLLPRPFGESVKLERTSSVVDRIESWREGVYLISKHPVLGVGFNALRFAKIDYFQDEGLLYSHSGAGLENSYLFIGATGGILGLLLYIVFLHQAFTGASLLGKATLIAAFVHGLFLNSLFYPWVMLWLWVIVAADSK